MKGVFVKSPLTFGALRAESGPTDEHNTVTASELPSFSGAAAFMSAWWKNKHGGTTGPLGNKPKIATDAVEASGSLMWHVVPLQAINPAAFCTFHGHRGEIGKLHRGSKSGTAQAVVAQETVVYPSERSGVLGSSPSDDQFNHRVPAHLCRKLSSIGVLLPRSCPVNRAALHFSLAESLDTYAKTDG